MGMLERGASIHQIQDELEDCRAYSRRLRNILHRTMKVLETARGFYQMPLTWDPRRKAAVAEQSCQILDTIASYLVYLNTVLNDEEEK